MALASLRQSYRQSGRIKSVARGVDPAASRTGAGWYSSVEFRQQKPGTEAQLLLNNRYDRN